MRSACPTCNKLMPEHAGASTDYCRCTHIRPKPESTAEDTSKFQEWPNVQSIQMFDGREHRWVKQCSGHVIEKSAYEALQAKVSELKDTVDGANAAIETAKYYYAELFKERDELRAKCEALEKVCQTLHTENVRKTVLEIAKQRDEAVAKCERLEAELSRERDIWHDLHNGLNSANNAWREQAEALAAALEFYTEEERLIKVMSEPPYNRPGRSALKAFAAFKSNGGAG